MRRLRTLTVSALFAWGFASNARAADEYIDNDTRVAARALASQGSQAFEQHDFERALGLFQRAGAIIQAPTITLMEARTLVELGRLVEALDKYGTTRHMLTVDPTNDVFRAAADSAQHEMEQLLQRIPTLRVHVLGAAPDEALELSIDGKKTPLAPDAGDRPIDPGTHHIEVSGRGGRSNARDVTLAERGHEDLELTLPPLAPVAPAPVPARERPAKVKSGNGWNTLGWTLVVSGGAFAAVGTITGVMALSAKSDLDKVCKPGCPPSQEDELLAFRRERTLSYVGFGLGALAVASGAYLVLSHPSGNVALNVSPRLVAIAGHFE